MQGKGCAMAVGGMDAPARWWGFPETIYVKILPGRQRMAKVPNGVKHYGKFQPAV